MKNASESNCAEKLDSMKYWLAYAQCDSVARSIARFRVEAVLMPTFLFILA
jgi:hypothetical protein